MYSGSLQTSYGIWGRITFEQWLLSTEYLNVKYLCGMTEEIKRKDMSSSSLGFIFRQQLRCESIIVILKSGTYNQMVYRKKEQDKRPTAIAVLTYIALLSSLLHLFGFFVLVFYLKQKHKEGQRLLHYLQQTNTALATGKFIYIYIYLCVCVCV